MEEFIRMCDCPEVQGNQYGKEGYLKIPDWDDLFSDLSKLLGCSCSLCVTQAIQDFYGDTVVAGLWDIAHSFATYKELLLAVIMWNKHRKLWNGKGWMKF